MYNDSVTTIGRGNGAMLVLCAAFDTIGHDNLFCILEKYVRIWGNALKLIKSYFSNRTQRVQIDNVLSDFANIICGVPQGSVFCSGYHVLWYFLCFGGFCELSFLNCDYVGLCMRCLAP